MGGELRAEPGCLTLAVVLRETVDVVRELAPSEERFVRHGTYTGRSVTVVGALRIAALRRAWADLRATHPILRCRIAADPSGAGRLLSPRGRAAGITVGSGDPDVLRLPARAPRPDRALGHLDVVCGPGGRARVTLYAHHAVADAGHCLALFANLWELYTAHADAAALPLAPRVLPLPLEHHVRAAGLTRAGVSGLEEVIAPVPPPPPPADHDAGPPSLAVPLRLRLERTATARLTGLARERGIPMNGLLTAAMLRAFAASRGVSAPVGCVYPVDLRPRLGPPIEATAGTNMAGLAAFSADIDLAADPAELAQRVSNTLRHDLAEGIVQQSVLHFPDFYGPGRIHSLAGHVAITNTGAVRPFRTPAGLRVEDYEIVYLSAHPRPSAGPGAAVTFLAYTFAERLSIGVLGGGDPERLAKVVAAELDRLAEGVAVSG